MCPSTQKVGTSSLLLGPEINRLIDRTLTLQRLWQGPRAKTTMWHSTRKVGTSRVRWEVGIASAMRTPPVQRPWPWPRAKMVWEVDSSTRMEAAGTRTLSTMTIVTIT